jgi:hypothetical protein
VTQECASVKELRDKGGRTLEVRSSGKKSLPEVAEKIIKEGDGLKLDTNADGQFAGARAISISCCESPTIRAAACSARRPRAIRHVLVDNGLILRR